MENNMKKKAAMADMALLLCAAIWGVGFVATDIALSAGITTYYTMAIRFSVAFILLALVFFKKLKSIKKKDLIAGGLVGLVLFAAFASQTVALKYTTPGKQAFLTGTNVVFVPFLYWAVKKKRPDGYTFAATVICLIGMALLSLNGDTSMQGGQLFGDMLTIVCAVFFAAHIVSVGYFTENVDPVVLTIVQMGVAALCSIIGIFVAGETMNFALIPAKGWIGVLYLGVVSTMIAYIIQNVAQKYTSSTHAAIILCLETIFGSLASVLLLGEQFTTKMVFGCALILIGLITAETKWSFLKKNKSEDFEEEFEEKVS